MSAPSSPQQLGQMLLDEVTGDKPDGDKIKELIAQGASLEETTKDDKKRTPLLVACESGHGHDAALILLAAGANPNARYQNGATPLLMAVLMRNQELAEALIAHGAALDDTGHKGKTPLMWAAHMGQYDLAKKLLDAGAHAELKMPDGMDAAAFAESNNKQRLQKYILEHIETQKAAKAAFDKAVRSGMPLEHDIEPLKMSAPRKRQRTPKNQPHPR